MEKIKEMLNGSRRMFLAGMGAVGAVSAASVLIGCGDSSRPSTLPVPVPLTDADILNFALNLEYLEAEYYLRATTGQGLSSADSGGTSAGAVNGGAAVSFTTQERLYANEIAQDELDHVRFLRSALGSAAVARPAIDFTNAFNGLAGAAGIGPAFNPFADANSFLLGAFVFEDVGVTAYKGAAPLITDKKTYLPPAAGILAVEAYHAAELRTRIVRGSLTTPSLLTNANLVSALRASLGGGSETPLTITANNATIANLDPSNGLAYSRTTDQVLHIVYATPAGIVSKGGFFPNGLNGKITTTAP